MSGVKMRINALKAAKKQHGKINKKKYNYLYTTLTSSGRPPKNVVASLASCFSYHGVDAGSARTRAPPLDLDSTTLC